MLNEALRMIIRYHSVYWYNVTGSKDTVHHVLAARMG